MQTNEIIVTENENMSNVISPELRALSIAFNCTEREVPNRLFPSNIFSRTEQVNRLKLIYKGMALYTKAEIIKIRK